MAEEKKKGSIGCRDLFKFNSYSCGWFTIPFLIIASLVPALNYLFVSEWLRVWVRQSLEEQKQSYYRNVFLGTIMSFFLTGVIRNFITASFTVMQTD